MASLEEYLSAELQRLDLLLHREILRLRARYQLSLDEFRGLYISDQQVDALVQNGVELCDPEDLTRRAAELRAVNAQHRPNAWLALESEFNLSPFEQDVVLLAVARELNLKYETLYAYLHNDVTRKKPTVELALRVCAPADRNAFLPQGRLFSDGLLTASSDHGFLGREITVPLPVLRYLTGLAPESSVPDADSACAHPAVAGSTALARLFLIEYADSDAARAAVETACHEADRRLLTLDSHSHDLPALAARIRIVQRLEKCGVCLLGSADLCTSDSRSAEVRHFFEAISAPTSPIWILLPPDTNWRGLIPAHAIRAIRLDEPTVQQRRDIWSAELPDAAPADVATLAASYSLHAGQIQSAAAYARDMLAIQGESRAPESGDLSNAVRTQSASTIGRFARRLVCRQSWDDLVLPPSTVGQIRELVGAIRHRHTVFSEWGFGRKHSGIEGLKVLFVGASGTGKTMTAGIIGNDLGLDVFRIDLSGVVSKYIGETEKNLDRVFRAAHGSQAILFFDEADALFGKRTEVKDAHDRYANIEVAYLLQKFEEHAGPVILATNLRRNVDEAFSRRLHFVVEFPPPCEADRLQLWHKVFPEEAPLAADVDFPFLAAQFPITGGDIRNVALDAAFLAAQNGGTVTMRQLAAAMFRQMLKQGKAPAIADFKQYHELLQNPGGGRGGAPLGM